MSTAQHALEQLDAALRADPALQERLFALTDDQAFCRAAQAAAAALGHPLEEEDLRAALNAGRRGWFERCLA